MKCDYESRLEALYTEYYGTAAANSLGNVKKAFLKAACSDLIKQRWAQSMVKKLKSRKQFLWVQRDLTDIRGIERTETDKCYNPHYKGVRYVLAYLLSPYIGKERPDSVLKNCLKDYVETMKYFALLNCYKCAFCDNPKGRPHSESMKEHCQEILFSEIEVLEPDIVVFQVKSKRPTNFEKNLANKFGKEELICGNEGTGAFWYSLRSGKRFIWIWTYHGDGNKYPRNQQNQQNQRNRGWASNDKSGKDYREKDLDPVLDRVLDAMRQLNLNETAAGNE